ncbi:S-adenosylmethionine-dependent methyltransferase, partial [Melia azedarach]
EKTKMVTHSDSAPMNGGNGEYSYSRNSHYQKQSADYAKDKIGEVIAATLDVKSLCSASNTFTLADLGCSVGPNTLFAMQNLIESIKYKYQNQCSSSPMPQFQVFFNDQASNDFNTLFISLPKDRQYFAAGVPGSFYGRLFPESSIHFAYSATSIHWLSKVPEELRQRDSPAWNKGRIHYTSASDEVIKAYKSQFAEDMENFLTARAKEIVSGGMIAIIVPSITDGVPFCQTATGLMFNCMASCLMDMVKLGMITEEEVDSFNLPLYGPSPAEMKELIECHGSFSIEKIQSSKFSSINEDQNNIPLWMAHIRAVMEGGFARQFGSQIVDEMFRRFTEKIIEHSDELEISSENSILLLLVLMLK